MEREMTMRQLSVFLSISLDGYFADLNGDVSWAHRDDPEFNAFVASNASAGGELLMGRRTYDLMASYWPTAMAKERDPIVADGMNSLPKIVFSRTMSEAGWINTRLIRENPAQAVHALKRAEGKDMVVLGSGSIVAQLVEAGLVDVFQLVVVPIALGAGQSVFAGISERLALTLTDSRAFAKGNVVLTYAPSR